jgi:hypothetical protein
MLDLPVHTPATLDCARVDGAAAFERRRFGEGDGTRDVLDVTVHDVTHSDVECFTNTCTLASLH